MDKSNAITEILEAFKNFDGTYKREQIDAAIELFRGIVFFDMMLLNANYKTVTFRSRKWDHLKV